MLYFFILAAGLGLTAGFSPGPMMTLVIAETIKYGRAAGFKVALAPLITDAPIILFSIFMLHKLENFHFILGLISCVGAAYLFYLGLENIRAVIPEVKLDVAQQNSIKKGVLTNLLNPQPYVFWLSIGAPLMHKGMQIDWYIPFMFIGVFYSLLVGVKLLMSILVEASSQFINGKVYVNILRVLGMFLWCLAIILLINGLTYFGVIASIS